MATDQEMIEDVTRLGVRAVVLLRGVMVKKVDRETLEWGLRELRPSDLLEKYLPRLLEKPEFVHLLNILHLVYSLEGQLDFDMQEINLSLQQVAEAVEVGGDVQLVNKLRAAGDGT